MELVEGMPIALAKNWDYYLFGMSFPQYDIIYYLGIDFERKYICVQPTRFLFY